MLIASLSRQDLAFLNMKLSLALNNFSATVLLPVTVHDEAVAMVKVGKEDLQSSLFEICCNVLLHIVQQDHATIGVQQEVRTPG